MSGSFTPGVSAPRATVAGVKLQGAAASNAEANLRAFQQEIRDACAKAKASRGRIRDVKWRVRRWSVITFVFILGTYAVHLSESYGSSNQMLTYKDHLEKLRTQVEVDMVKQK